MALTLALDIGGTKIAWGLIDDDAPRTVIAHGRVPSQPAGGNTADQLEVAVTEALAAPALSSPELAAGNVASARTSSSTSENTIARVGVAAAGVIDPITATVTRAGATMPGWEGTDIAARIARHIDAPVFAHNDVRVWAFGEHTLCWRDEYPHARLLYVSLGTGVGGAFVINDDLAAGNRGTAGEISELYCPHYGSGVARCEDVASGPKLVATYHEAISERDGQSGSGRDVNPASPSTVTDLLELERQGNSLATEVLDRNLHGFGQMLGTLAMGIDLDAIILGGGVSGLGEAITRRIRDGVRSHLAYSVRPCDIRDSALREGPLVAAAVYARARHKRS
ncbi:ROK family protein [Corynebacterium sp. MC-04]|uniref:ROK family protein n=1 Tax=Corynebacterium parakroppenstedtii TaxID=2828363 RepID=A0ABS9HML7_9CORY|nr:ROK family protein [Corynebacterium parakroppenstedtii]KXB49568.1 ROK family protein [Corynebacterium kroppenstedtii]MCZ9302230.1 ROK family protein [Corynebacterium sp. c24U_166]MBY0792576.1 ROK family protein [Corynebacterium parakroppenstedtii]MBY0796677.1 ROK family protein [Corynebacterium parakroppenstedtii]MCF6769933.1 ROK family protein [Corynebacterium parakroppenstedtii]